MRNIVPHSFHLSKSLVHFSSYFSDISAKSSIDRDESSATKNGLKQNNVEVKVTESTTTSFEEEEKKVELSSISEVNETKNEKQTDDYDEGSFESDDVSDSESEHSSEKESSIRIGEEDNRVNNKGAHRSTKRDTYRLEKEERAHSSTSIRLNGDVEYTQDDSDDSNSNASDDNANNTEEDDSVPSVSEAEEENQRESRQDPDCQSLKIYHADSIPNFVEFEGNVRYSDQERGSKKSGKLIKWLSKSSTDVRSGSSQCSSCELAVGKINVVA